MSNRIPFLKALNLVQTRSVYIEAGFAFVPFAKLVSIVLGQVRDKSLVANCLFVDYLTGCLCSFEWNCPEPCRKQH
jgi:hypothetical protein